MVRYGFQFNKEKTAEKKLADELKAKARRLKARELDGDGFYGSGEIREQIKAEKKNRKKKKTEVDPE